MAEFEKASHSFLAWLHQSGADISPKIQLEDLRSRGAGRGVVAVQDIQEHEVLFRIPRSAILSVENSILSTEIPTTTFDFLGPWLSLILVMLYEHLNGHASNWAPYFAVLPTDFNTLMFWSEDELAELQASAVIDKIGRDGANTAFTELLLPIIKEFANVFFAGDECAAQKADEMRDEQNLTLMHKMGSLIMAYAFDVEPVTPRHDVDEEGFAEVDDDDALPKGMIPLADMLNADANRCNAHIFYEQEYLEMKALKPIKTGEEILNDYGPLPRSDLLRRYGYITDNYAQYDVVEIPMDLVSDIAATAGAWVEARLVYLDEQDIVDTGYDVTASSPFTLHESLSPDLVVLIETMLLPDDEFARMQQKQKLPKPEKITSQAAHVMQSILQARLAQYATTLDEDLRQPLDATCDTRSTSLATQRAALAQAVRIGEKQILVHAKEALAETIARAGMVSKRQRDFDEEGDVEMGGIEKKPRA